MTNTKSLDHHSHTGRIVAIPILHLPVSSTMLGWEYGQPSGSNHLVPAFPLYICDLLPFSIGQGDFDYGSFRFCCSWKWPRWPPCRHSGCQASGEEIYNDKCVYCHSRRGWGTRVLSRRVPEGQAELAERALLPAAFTAAVVRQGIGSMPAFTPTDLSDEEIAVVAQWLEPGS